MGYNTEQELRDALKLAKAKLIEQQETIERLSTLPARFASVVEIRGETTVIAAGSEFLEVVTPPRSVGDLVPGITVRMSNEGQIAAIVKACSLGDLCIVKQPIDGGFAEIEHGPSTRVVVSATKVKSGDRVIMDSSNMIIVRNLGGSEKKFVAEAVDSITWDRVGGLDDAKRVLIEAIEYPHVHKDVFARWNKKPCKGFLFYGPPGCGKTLLGKAVATSLAKLHGKDEGGFMYVKGPEVLDPFVGVAEATIRQLFARAKRYKAEHGYPAVLFLDEADALLSKRGSGIGSHIERTIVPMFLTEMDGLLGDSGAIVIMATNRPDILDPAAVREGRIDRKVKIGRPDFKASRDIFSMYLKDKPMRATPGELAEAGRDALFSKERVMFDVRRPSEVLKVTLGDMCSGAMISTIVDDAASTAMRREIEEGDREGVTEKDILGSIESIQDQYRGMDQQDALREILCDYNDIEGISRAAR